MPKSKGKRRSERRSQRKQRRISSRRKSRSRRRQNERTGKCAYCDQGKEVAPLIKVCPCGRPGNPNRLLFHFHCLKRFITDHSDFCPTCDRVFRHKLLTRARVEDLNGNQFTEIHFAPYVHNGQHYPASTFDVSEAIEQHQGGSSSDEESDEE